MNYCVHLYSNLKTQIMKNFKKLSRNELKAVKAS